jgi:ribonuclease R
MAQNSPLLSTLPWGDPRLNDLKEEIRKLLKDSGGRVLKLGDIIRILGIGPEERRTVRRILKELETEGDTARLRGHSYVSGSATKVIEGKLVVTRKGFGFVIPDVGSPEADQVGDIYVSRKAMGDAMNNDRVHVRLLPTRPPVAGLTGMRREGRIMDVVERANSKIAGVYFPTRRGGNVIPHDTTIGRTITVPHPPAKLNVQEGAFVLAEITLWTASTEPLLGKVVEVLGYPEDTGIDVTLIVRAAGVDPEFPAAVLREAEAVPMEIPAEEAARRTDFRDIATFTMDGPTAKDFDDALSIERLENGKLRLGVHIADVSHYVQENSPLDLEALERGTSIYPVDRVIPMLPEKLSNGICSLRPNEDRLTLSCLMDIDDQGRVSNYSVHEGIIRSRHRLIYEQVQDLTDGKAEPAIARELGDIIPELEDLYRLRKILTAMRLRRGSLDLDVPETEIQFDDEGNVSNVVRRSRLEAHRVVEECMLIANEVVATHLYNLHVPSVYRVHEDPDLDKLRNLQPVLAHLGVRFPARKDIDAFAIQTAIEKSSATAAGSIARRLILRSMMRARYLDENLGHYGLGSACYTHFTSPIRRYPDLLVHRLLRETLQNGAAAKGKYRPPAFGASLDEEPVKFEGGRRGASLPPERYRHWEQRLPQWTRHSSERERRAELIEREAIAAKSVEYMRKFIGETFSGMLTAVTNFGFFVELDDIPVEGLVHMTNLNDDYYEFDTEHMRLVGRDSGRVFKLGDRVVVQVESASVATTELNFALVEKVIPEGSEEKTAALDRRRIEKEGRHKARRPNHGGFQSRGKAKKGRR